MNFLIVFIAGGLGSVARYVMMTAVGRVMGTNFPWHTLSVNLLGAVLIGAVAELLALRAIPTETARLLLVTGFLGGFTTFSAFSLENALMWQKGDYVQLAAYVTASVVGTLIAVLCGTAVMKTIL